MSTSCLSVRRFVCFESQEQFFSYLATVTITGDGTANLDLCLALPAFSSEGSFKCHTYCDTGPPFPWSYLKDPWFYLLLAKEQSLPISNVLGLTRPARAGLELTTFRLLSESTTTRLRHDPYCVCEFSQQLLITGAWNFSTLSVGMPYGGIHFCMNQMPTSCLSVRLSVECMWNFRQYFLGNYSLQMLEILARSFFWHAIWWDSFLSESDANFLFICTSVRRIYIKFLSQFPQQLLISGAWNLSTFFWQAIWWDSFL
jgi:hypothetical protein